MRGVPLKTIAFLFFLASCLVGWQLAETRPQASAATIWQCPDGTCFEQPRPFLRPNYYLSVIPDSLAAAVEVAPLPLVEGGQPATVKTQVEAAQPTQGTALAQALNLPPGAVIVSVVDSPAVAYRSVITRRRVLSSRTYTCEHGNTHTYRTFRLPGRERRMARRAARRGY